MEHNYMLEDLELEDVVTLDALSLLKAELDIESEGQRPTILTKITYLKGYNIDYVQSLDIAEIISKSQEFLKDSDLAEYSFKAFKKYSEWAVLYNGLVYTYDSETKLYFAMKRMRGNTDTSIVEAGVAVISREDALKFEKSQIEHRETKAKHMLAMKELINIVNIQFTEQKINVFIKYSLDEKVNYIDSGVVYKGMTNGLYNPNWSGNEISADEALAKRRVYYTFYLLESSGITKLSVDIIKPESGSGDLDMFCEGCVVLADGMLEYGRVAKILGEAALAVGLTFKY